MSAIRDHCDDHHSGMAKSELSVFSDAGLVHLSWPNGAEKITLLENASLTARGRTHTSDQRAEFPS